MIEAVLIAAAAEAALRIEITVAVIAARPAAAGSFKPLFTSPRGGFFVYTVCMPPENFQEKQQHIAPLRTMRQDVASLLKKGQSPADMISRGTPRDFSQERLAREFSQARRWQLFYWGGIIVVILIALSASWFFFVRPQSPPAPISPEMPVFLPLPVDRTEEVTFRLGDREGLIRAIKGKKTSPDKGPVFLSLRLTRLGVAESETRFATSFEVFDTLRLRPPQTLLRSFTPELFAFFVGGELILIVPISNTAKALEGFLAWEALMVRDFAPLLSSDAPILFRDAVIKNVDARVSASVSYALFGGRYAVIGLSEASLDEVINLLAKRGK